MRVGAGIRGRGTPAVGGGAFRWRYRASLRAAAARSGFGPVPSARFQVRAPGPPAVPAESRDAPAPRLPEAARYDRAPGAGRRRGPFGAGPVAPGRRRRGLPGAG
ncbi:hypothetical protein GCM10010421_08390 [Streptomyces glaucus]|uniref:Secreted protein n=1 Tax=Streptomyces glaucus TaxID=284029 RepID=A0ABN3J9X1_9ACTN